MATSPIKWVGSKRAITPTLIEHMPKEFNSYYEPFAGGLSLFLALSPMEGHRAHLSDTNEELINAYKVIRTNSTELMERLDLMAGKHSEEYYYQIRAQHHLSDPVERAARFIFINKTGYNGLWRVNSKNECNTPWGHKKDPVKLYDHETIEECARALRTAKLTARSYAMARPRKGDFIYLDPPYDATYNGYAKNGFGEEGQRSLAEYCRRLDQRGVMFMLSNSNTDLIKDLYNGYDITLITAPRYVSCRSDGRKPVVEVLITNYGEEVKRGVEPGGEG